MKGNLAGPDPVFEQRINDAWKECHRFFQRVSAGEISEEEGPQPTLDGGE